MKIEETYPGWFRNPLLRSEGAAWRSTGLQILQT